VGGFVKEGNKKVTPLYRPCKLMGDEDVKIECLTLIMEKKSQKGFETTAPGMHKGHRCSQTLVRQSKGVGKRRGKSGESISQQSSINRSQTFLGGDIGLDKGMASGERSGTLQ